MLFVGRRCPDTRKVREHFVYQIPALVMRLIEQAILVHQVPLQNEKAVEHADRNRTCGLHFDPSILFVRPGLVLPAPNLANL